MCALVNVGIPCIALKVKLLKKLENCWPTIFYSYFHEARSNTLFQELKDIPLHFFMCMSSLIFCCTHLKKETLYVMVISTLSTVLTSISTESKRINEVKVRIWQ